MEHCIRIGTFGAQRKGVIGRVSKGDKVACYITKEYKIIALGEITKGYYMDDSKVFIREGVFPDRFDFQASKLGESEELEFMKIVDQMSFITNLAYWSVYFRTGAVKISKLDWQKIEQAIAAQKN